MKGQKMAKAKMVKYRVIKDFVSRTNGQAHRVGETTEPTAERAAELVKLGFIASIVEDIEGADETDA
jgi:hypothetical protein